MTGRLPASGIYGLLSKLLAWPFLFLQFVLPKHLLTTLVFHTTRFRTKPVKDFLIRRFIAIYKVNVEEASRSVPDGYVSFNDFFTRSLVDGARPIDSSADVVISPVDGTVSAAGTIDADRLMQAKGKSYSLSDLLMTAAPRTGASRPYILHRTTITGCIVRSMHQ